MVRESPKSCLDARILPGAGARNPTVSRSDPSIRANGKRIVAQYGGPEYETKLLKEELARRACGSLARRETCLADAALELLHGAGAERVPALQRAIEARASARADGLDRALGRLLQLHREQVVGR
jgi:hypothetical protein